MTEINPQRSSRFHGNQYVVAVSIPYPQQPVADYHCAVWRHKRTSKREKRPNVKADLHERVSENVFFLNLYQNIDLQFFEK